MEIDESSLRGLIAKARRRVGIWKRILDSVQPKVVAEIGVWKGEFSSAILASCPSIETYYMVDPWAQLPSWNKPINRKNEVFERIYAEAMDATSFAADKRCVLRGTTKDVLDNIPDQSLDFAYLDGDHTLRGMTIDLIKILPKMKPGAIIGGDDFERNPWHQGPKFEPTMVCPFSIYFAEAHNLPIFALPFHQCLIHVRADAGFSFIDIAGTYSDISLKKIPRETGAKKRRIAQGQKARPRKNARQKVARNVTESA